jgi:isocitrate dehydrogenase
MMSLHMKATMMKISDPIIFGHCVKVYFKASHFIRLLCFQVAQKKLEAYERNLTSRLVGVIDRRLCCT